jgi:predicted DNA-binding transcriptional regulator YafY
VHEDGKVRSDRLVAILLLLQQRGHVTAAEIAAELETSERTARRDLDALGAAGLPVYSVQGRGGGWRLLGDGRTDLSGLTNAEVRALFLVAGPHAATTPTVRAALRKLLRALPEPFRDGATAAAASTLADQVPWQGSTPRSTPPLLGAVQDAVIAGHELALDYVDRTGAPTTRDVHPLGVVSKGASWYLIADTAAGRRTFRIDRICASASTGRQAMRPSDFDLAAAWAEIAAGIDDLRAPVVATGQLQPGLVGALGYLLGSRAAVGRSSPDGRVEVVLRGRTAEVLAAEIAGFGDGLEISGPPEVRASLARIGAALVALYP